MAAGTIGKYERLDVLGHGTSGVVYLAWDTLLRRQVALKEIRADGPETERLLEEARVLDRLHHPHIVRIHSVDVVSGIILLDMELVQGRNLASVLKERAGNPMPESEAVRIVTAVLDALGYAHERRIIHRDIKPANILFGNDGMIKLTDFGLAEALGTGSVAGGGGTYPYMAPEDFAEDAASDRRSDLWAVGVLLYELLTGKRPFTVQRIKDPFAWKRAVEQDTPTPPHEINPALSSNWDVLLAKALAKNKSERFSTAREFIDAIANVASATTTTTAPVDPGSVKTTAMPVFAPPVTGVRSGAFVFTSTGEIVYTLDELLRVAARNWDESRRALLDGRVEGFLRAIGEIYVADLAGECFQRGHRGESPDKLLTEFLDRAQGDEPEEAGTVMAPPRFAPVFRVPVMQRQEVRHEETGTVMAPPVAPPRREEPQQEAKVVPDAPDGVRWWYWFGLLFSTAPLLAALFAGVQPGFHYEFMQTLLVSATIGGLLSVMLLLIAVGTRMNWTARVFPVPLIGIGCLAFGGIIASAGTHNVSMGLGGLLMLAVPIAVLLIQAATARALWRLWVGVFFALSALSVGFLASLH